MVREQLNGTMHHSAACRLVADTFLAVVADLGQAAESDLMSHVAPRIERTNGRFFHLSDLIARNKMVTGHAVKPASDVDSLGSAHASTPLTVADDASAKSFARSHHRAMPAKGATADGKDDPSFRNARRTSQGAFGAAVEHGLAAHAAPGTGHVPSPVIDQVLALQHFGGDVGFLTQMCAKFVASGRGVAERIQGLAESLSLGAASSTPMATSYTELRREAHSLKGASSTIGAMRLSQAALDPNPNPNPSPSPNPNASSTIGAMRLSQAALDLQLRPTCSWPPYPYP